jgi:hypothetical protein
MAMLYSALFSLQEACPRRLTISDSALKIWIVEHAPNESALIGSVSVLAIHVGLTEVLLYPNEPYHEFSRALQAEWLSLS